MTSRPWVFRCDACGKIEMIYVETRGVAVQAASEKGWTIADKMCYCRDCTLNVLLQGLHAQAPGAHTVGGGAMNDDTPRIDRLRLAVWTGLLLAFCVIANAVAWAMEQAWRTFGPWVLAHADAIAGAVLAVCAVLLVVLAVAERAKKDNWTW